MAVPSDFFAAQEYAENWQGRLQSASYSNMASCSTVCQTNRALGGLGGWYYRSLAPGESGSRKGAIQIHDQEASFVLQMQHALQQPLNISHCFYAGIEYDLLHLASFTQAWVSTDKGVGDPGRNDGSHHVRRSGSLG